MAAGAAEQGARVREWWAYALCGVPGALLALAAHAGLLPERAAVALFALSFVALNLAHMAATWSRVYLAPGYTAAALRERLVVPAALAGFALAFEAVGGAAALLAAQFYISLHHGLMQNYGVLRASQRRAGRALAPRALWLDQAACVLAPLAALAYRAAAVCDRYDGARAYAPPAGVIAALAAAGALAWVAYGARELAAARRGARVDPLGPLMVYGVGGLWAATLIALPHPALPFWAVASGHYVQYLAFVRGAEARRGALALGRLPPTVRSLIAPDRAPAWRYYTALFALGAAGALALTLVAVAARAAAGAAGLRPAWAMDIPPWAAAMLAINLHHYWLDRYIWRAPREAVPRLAPG